MKKYYKVQNAVYFRTKQWKKFLLLHNEPDSLLNSEINAIFLLVQKYEIKWF